MCYLLFMTKDERWLLDEKYDGIETPEFESDKKRLAQGEPLGYVIGWQPFLGLKIHLDSKPLIPRPETEWWTVEMLRETPKGPCAFLDMCAGSGAIGCAALATLPEARVYFGEIDPAHETTIQKNIHENHLDASRGHVRIGDLFEPFGDKQFDAIAINPPYIPSDRTLDSSVKDHEPSLALFSGHDGLDLMRRIATQLPMHLTPHGNAWIECDSAHATEAATLFKNEGLSVAIRTDQYHIPRILVVSYS